MTSMPPCSKICKAFRKIKYIPTSYPTSVNTHVSHEKTAARILAVLKKKGQRIRHMNYCFKKTSNSIDFNQDAEQTCVACNKSKKFDSIVMF
jgi:hypothetical protein